MNAPQSFHFSVYDYVVFASMLGVSSLIGVYYAFFAKQKQNTTSEYLLGGKKIGVFPMSMSLIASYVSGIALMGVPSEIYVYGTQSWMMFIPELVACYVMSTSIIPVFYTLDITSSYEYLNRRFGPHVRTLASLLFILKMMLYIPIAMYLPSLAFAQVSGLRLHAILPVVCAVCTFYTTLGGLKAVVWTDTLQIFLMLLGVVTVITLGIINVGGFDNVWQRSYEGGRIDFFNMSWDPRVRLTFWNVTIGEFFQHLSICTVNQAMVQRCLAMPSLKKAKIMIFIFAIGIALFVNLCCFTGLVIYASFHDCDPKKIGHINKADQIVPYFVIKMAGHIPLLPGIFISGVFSAALSTMSTGLNAMSGIILEDFVKPWRKTSLSERKASFIMKFITVCLGAMTALLALIVDQLDGVMQTTFSLHGITTGTLLGMFLLGMFLPWANTAGALTGGLAAATLVGWMCTGFQLALHRKQLIYPVKPVSVEGCYNVSLPSSINKTVEVFPPGNSDDLLMLYQISYIYYPVIGVATVLTVGLIVSYFTGFNDPKEMNPDVLSPVLKSLLIGKIKPKVVRQKSEDISDHLNLPQIHPLLGEETVLRSKSKK